MYILRRLIVLSICLPLSIGYAQTSSTENEEEFGIEEITVTAQKRETLLHQTPLAISAFSEKYLKDEQITQVVDIGNRTPGFSLYEISPGQSTIAMRGVATTDASPGTDQPVAMFLDDVYMGRPQDVQTDLFGLERVEVLRGPQGTLFGRNAVGGVIHFITKNPGEETEAEFDLTLGSRNRQMIRGYLSAPLSDTLFANLTVKSDRQDGWATNLFSGNDAEAKNISSARGKLRWVSSDDLEIIFAADATSDRRTGHYAGIFYGEPEIFPNILTYNDNVSLQSFDGDMSIDAWGTSVRVNWDVDFLGDDTTFTSISAWRTSDTIYNDTDIGPSDVQDFYFNLTTEDVGDEQFTQEIRLGGNSDRLTWVGGMYFLWGSHDRVGILDISAAPPGTLFHDDYGTGVFTDLEYQRVDTTSLAFFGQATYSFNDIWSVTGGLRWTYDEKDMHSTGQAGAGFFQLEDFDVMASDDWDATTPMVSIQGSFEDTGAFESLFVFASATKGYKAGGYNVQAGTAAGILPSVAPEFAWSYEVGVKTRSGGGRLGINVVAFHQTLEDLQTQVFSDMATFSQENAGETSVDGVEFELSAAISEGFDVGLTYSWMDAEYDVFIDGETDFSGQRVPQAPETTYSIDASYSVPVGNGDLSFRANFSHRSWIYITPLPPGAFYPIQNLTERDTLDAFLTYEGERWSIGAYGRNLTDDRPITFALDLGYGWLTLDETIAGEQVWSGRRAKPREYGITIGWRMQ